MAKKSTGHTITNNGEIIFTYSTAEEMGISRSSFMRAIDDLLARGFIYIAHEGGGMKGDATKYGLSEDWKKYGRADFKPTGRSSRRGRFPNAGFKKGHTYHPPNRTKQHGDLKNVIECDNAQNALPTGMAVTKDDNGATRGIITSSNGTVTTYVNCSREIDTSWEGT